MNPPTVLDAFTRLRDDLKLDPAELARAIAVHNVVTDHLRDKGLITGAFLQGSLARKTMIAPLRDIDKVVLLAVDYRSIPDGQQRAAEAVVGALKELYPHLDPTIGKHCVTLDLGDTTFSFDIVPAIDLGDDVEIINTERRTWQVSNTRELIRVVQQRNKVCDGDFVHQVRFGKLFTRNHLDGHLPGLHVESFAFMAITTKMHDDEALAALLRVGASALGPGGSYTDPTRRDDLGRRLHPTERHLACSSFEAAAAQAAEAVQLRHAGENNAAIAIWHHLLDHDFPRPSAARALANLGTGSGVSSASVVTRSAPVRPTPTRAWCP